MLPRSLRIRVGDPIMNSMPTLSATDLLKDVWYAFEQCGHLLDHAMTLYERGAYPTAVGLAMLAREELGKARIWLRLWQEVEIRGRTVTIEEAQHAGEDHVRKQANALLSITQRADLTTPASRLLADAIAEDPQHPEVRAEARRKLAAIADRQRKRIPSNRSEDRERAFYVDARETGGWSRPVETFSEQRARDELTDAGNDYAKQWEKLQPERMRFDLDQKLADALEAWTDRPPLPVPRRPWDWSPSS
jgi:AbiV family abortive infection protein